jgi:hypothetical protein
MNDEKRVKIPKNVQPVDENVADVIFSMNGRSNERARVVRVGTW